MVSKWGGWSSCSITCGVGVQRNTRKCLNRVTEAQEDDYKCLKEGEILENKKECDMGYCPGNSLHVYQHFYEVSLIKTTVTIFVAVLSFFIILVDGKWTIWLPWSNCNVGCGEGKRERHARCGAPAPANGGKECKGGERDNNNDLNKIEVEECMARDEYGNPKECPGTY